MSYIAPSLPETAPFSPAQRAWLDGFIGGLLGDSGNDPDATSLGAGQDAVMRRTLGKAPDNATA